MFTINPSFEEGLDTLVKIAKEHPDHRDPAGVDPTGNCQYYYDRDYLEAIGADPEAPPRCIAGQWLHKFGVDDLDLIQFPETMVSGLIGEGLFDELDSRLVAILEWAQDRQDHGATWHEAVVGAFEEYVESNPDGDDEVQFRLDQLVTATV